jgi:hypothetical protein
LNVELSVTRTVRIGINIGTEISRSLFLRRIHEAPNAAIDTNIDIDDAKKKIIKITMANQIQRLRLASAKHAKGVIVNPR